VTIEFDPAKDKTNVAKHGISLSRATEFEILAFIEDDRREYRETRYRAWGLIDDMPHCLVFTIRRGQVRAISLRRAHKKEIDRYVTQEDDA
jgi:uncharacterized DUF497 family protein